ncbi:GNAT family N-acetyltransferase [Endozoicomonas lisbonensis]|uniref:ElaA protein n=1 Tax=Endozoicomonas lisbonensis TaxID=3120522 RepID=A0ABV2SKM5_9GAMM
MIEWEWCHYETLSLNQLYEILAVRQSVFVVEQNCAYQDADGLDQVAYHLMGWAFNDDGRKALAAYARVIPPEVVKPELAIGRVITAEAFRGQGLGRALLAEAVRLSEETFPDSDIYLSAQAHLQSYYGGCGFVASGELYDEDGIPHIAMFRRKHRQQPVSGTNLSQ